MVNLAAAKETDMFDSEFVFFFYQNWMAVWLFRLKLCFWARFLPASFGESVVEQHTALQLTTGQWRAANVAPRMFGRCDRQKLHPVAF